MSFHFQSTSQQKEADASDKPALANKAKGMSVLDSGVRYIITMDEDQRQPLGRRQSLGHVYC